MNVQNWNLLIERLFTIAVVIIGGLIGLLSPVILYQIEKRKSKSSLKSTLIETTSMFYGFHKQHFQTLNYSALTQRVLHFRLLQLLAPENEAEEVNLQEICENLKSEIRKLDERFTGSYSKLVEIESKIISLTFEIQKYYGVETFKSISSLIKPIISEANDYTKIMLHDYKNLTWEQTKVVDHSLTMQIVKKHHEFQNKLGETINEINSVI